VTTLEQRPAGTPARPAGENPAPGWYDDPSDRYLVRVRYWNGDAWTPGVAIDGRVFEEPLASPLPPPAVEHDERAVLPTRAAVIGITGLVVGAVLGIVVGLALKALGDVPKALLIVVPQLFLWGGMVGACLLVSRRHGSGSMRRDYGVRVRTVDLGWGLLLALAARVLAAVVVATLAAASHRLAGSNLTGIRELRHDTAALTAYALLAVVGAPLVEELFFRGLLLRSFVGRLGLWGAVPAQAFLFCLVHTIPSLGLGNVSVLAATFLFGAFAGSVVTEQRRLGPTMIGHSIFNLVAVAAVLAVT
jgi:membrane protease YdiL (CAAX protease family)